MLWGMRTSLFNDSACYSSHHFTSTYTSWGRMLNVMIADKRHVICVWGTTSYRSSSCDNISSACIYDGISGSGSSETLSSSGNIVLILVLARDLLRSLMTALWWGTSWLGWEFFIHKFSDSIGTHQAYSFFAALTIYHTHIDAWRPILISLRLRWLTLSSILFLQQFLSVLSCVFGREPVVIIDLILVLLHVITTSSIDPRFIWIVASVSLVLLLLWGWLLPAKHAPQLAISYGIISLLLHFLIQLVESRRLFERAAVSRGALSLSRIDLKVR